MILLVGAFFSVGCSHGKTATPQAIPKKKTGDIAKTLGKPSVITGDIQLTSSARSKPISPIWIGHNQDANEVAYGPEIIDMEPFDDYPPKGPHSEFSSTLAFAKKGIFIGGKYKGQDLILIHREYGNGAEQNRESSYTYAAWSPSTKALTAFSKFGSVSSFFSATGSDGQSNGQKIMTVLGAKFAEDGDFFPAYLAPLSRGAILTTSRGQNLVVTYSTPNPVNSFGPEFGEIPGIGMVYWPSESQLDVGAHCRHGDRKSQFCLKKSPEEFGDDDAQFGVTELRLKRAAGETVFLVPAPETPNKLNGVQSLSQEFTPGNEYESSALFHFCNPNKDSLSLSIQPPGSLDPEKDLEPAAKSGEMSLLFFRKHDHQILQELFKQRGFLRERTGAEKHELNYETFIKMLPILFFKDSGGRLVRFLRHEFTGNHGDCG
ncbi:MAG: hypothetical protein ACXVCB_06790 [Bdellovibrionota bacterium]